MVFWLLQCLIEKVLQAVLNFKQISFWVFGQSFRYFFYFKLAGLHMSNLFSLHVPYFMAFTCGISAGVDRTATSVLCRHSESNPCVGGGCCFFKLPIFIFLTHQTKSPEQNSLHLNAQHPAADLSSAKQGAGRAAEPQRRDESGRVLAVHPLASLPRKGGGGRRGSVLQHSSHFKLLLAQLEIIAIASAAKESYEIWQNSEGKR